MNKVDGDTIRELGVFVGRWRTEGVIDPGNGQPQVRLEAIDIYEWFPGGYFLIHHVDGRMGEAEVKALEVIGYDQEAGGIISRSYDNGGQTSEYNARLDGKRWSIEGKTERFNGMFNADFSELDGIWERLDGGAWRSWINIRLRKE